MASHDRWLALVLGGGLLLVGAPAALAEPPPPGTPGAPGNTGASTGGWGVYSDGSRAAKIGCAAAATAQDLDGVKDKYQSCQSVGDLARHHEQLPDGRKAPDPCIGSEGQLLACAYEDD